MDTTHKQPFMINGGQANDRNTALPPQTPDRITELQYSVWAIRDAIERMNRDIQLLLDERTRPLTIEAVQVEAKKLPTEETPQVTIAEDSVREFADALTSNTKPKQAHSINLLQARIVLCGGPKIMAKKYHAGLLRVQFYKHNGTWAKERGYYGHCAIEDETLPRTKSGLVKTFGINTNSRDEYLAILDKFSAMFNTDFRSRYA